MIAPETTLQVLLVEDDDPVALELEDLLRRGGYQVQGVAKSVTAALAFLETERPDVVIMDVRLGRELATPVARELRGAGIPYIVISGMPERTIPEDILGEARFVSKPHHPAKLLRELARLGAAAGSGRPDTAAGRIG